MNILTQIIGIAAMIIAIISFQQKTQKRIVFLQFCSGGLFCLHFFLLDAKVGCMLNLIGVIRAVIFAQCEKHRWARSKIWILVFSVLSLMTYFASFIFFDKEFNVLNSLTELLPVIGMIATTLAYRERNAARVRRLAIISSPAWLCYNILCGSIGGAVTEGISILSILTAMYRLDRKKKQS